MTRDRDRLRSQVEDAQALQAGLQALRMKHDPEYRDRYGKYLRGLLERTQLEAGESHQAWLERATGR